MFAVSLVAAAAVTLAPVAAYAQCMAPSPAMFPLGHAVPPRPLIYVFAPPYADADPIRIDGPGGPIPFASRDVSTYEGVRITELRVDARRGWFVVRAGEHGAPRRYEIESPPPPPPIGAPDAIAWEHSEWTCSHTTGLAIDLRAPGVVAFRVRWGAHVELVPPNARAFFMSAMGGEIDPAALHVFLGHPSCVGNLIDPAFIGRRDFDLTAIYSDGSEQEVPLPREAESAKPADPPPAPPPSPAASPDALSEPPEAANRRAAHGGRQSRASSPVAERMAAAAGAIGALVTVILVLLVRRRRAVAVP
jgi:hypothetical protein